MCKRWQSTIYGGTERVLYSTQVHIHRYVYRYVVTYTERRRREYVEQDKGGRMYARYERTGV